MDRLWRDIHNSYVKHLILTGKEQAFWMLVAFILTFALVRIITHAIRDGRGPFGNVKIGSLHLHHLVPGIILLLVSGYLANAVHPREARNVIAVMFGVGAALTLDEFALWIHLRDVYWTKEGRRSIDAVIFAASASGLFVLGVGFWSAIGHALARFVDHHVLR